MAAEAHASWFPTKILALTQKLADENGIPAVCFWGQRTDEEGTDEPVSGASETPSDDFWVGPLGAIASQYRSDLGLSDEELEEALQEAAARAFKMYERNLENA